MTDIRRDPRLRDLAQFARHFSDHPDIAELQRRGQVLIAAHAESADLAELAATYVDSPEHRAELVRSAKEVLREPLTPMTPRQRLGVGVYLTALGVLLLAVTPQAWSIATRALTGGPVTVTVLAMNVRVTEAMALMSAVILMGLIGSMTVMTLVFARRAGNSTLEEGFIWWYVTRPLTAAGLAVLFYVVAISGFIDLASIEGTSALVVASALAALAGLFTDQVLEKMRGVLGLLRFHEAAAGKDSEAES